MLEELLNNVDGHSLDQEQRNVVLDESDSLLVVASAGSGKTLTILGKIRYLIEIKKVNPREILCISFTNDTVNNLKNKLLTNYGYKLPVFTFHKLALEILKTDNYKIALSDYLDYCLTEYFSGEIYKYPKLIFKILFYFRKNPFFKKNYSELIESNEFKEFLKEISAFINRYKTEGKDKEELLVIIKEEKNPKNKFYLKILYILFAEYEVELTSQGLIDFEDMIKLATKKVSSENALKYKYIIIDEYQDTSNLRFSLIKEIKNKTKAKLMVVGDDFQSIYRFSGCNIELFINFQKYFSNARILKLEKTYRNSQELINYAGTFVLKNKNQISKCMKSDKTYNNPIKIIWYQDEKRSFLELIQKLAKENHKKILVLGRNNYDIHHILSNDFKYEYGKLEWQKDKTMQINYKTVHRSKGLEEEIVIVIHLVNNKNGFPNLKRDSKILKKIFPNFDNYPYSEERRLFYVALTRTKTCVYLLASKENSSIFVQEIKRIINKKNDI